MEEKKIIGQECEFYNEGHCLCYSDESHYPHCLEYPKCYYKQLQLKDKMIESVVSDLKIYAIMLNSPEQPSTEECIKFYKQQALAELEE